MDIKKTAQINGRFLHFAEVGKMLIDLLTSTKLVGMRF